MGDSGNVKTRSFCPTCGSPVYLGFSAMPDLFAANSRRSADGSMTMPMRGMGMSHMRGRRLKGTTRATGLARSHEWGMPYLVNPVQAARSHRALAAGAPPDWAELALELGYFDQAHFIRDFTALVGRSPVAGYFRTRRGVTKE